MRRLASVHSVQNKDVNPVGNADIPMAGALYPFLLIVSKSLSFLASTAQLCSLLCSYFTAEKFLLLQWVLQLREHAVHILSLQIWSAHGCKRACTVAKLLYRSQLACQMSSLG